ncbi:ATP-binding protein [Anabaena sp. AL09]|jgi:tetratricopeptide (TPR) repeat protein|uniref:ATP-binding protein n=1 Tax=Anabaena sp. AL09 TaxID=1710891 RepID=UPI0007FF6072|nr:ATP-binding protein [Anabaena sp. AL09]OBQ02573.1 MAG: hypothetical protein AN490_18405 [Anabaena sp. AL09]
MSYIPNRYIIGRPITEPDKFFGRQDLFQFIYDNLNNNETIILLFGQRRIGKTSVLKQVSQQIDKLVQHNKYSFVNFELANLSLSDVLYELSETIIKSLKLSESEIELPSITKFKQDPDDAFFRILLPQIYQRIDHNNLVLLLDEFDVFENGNEFLNSIRKINSIWKDEGEVNKLFCIPVLGKLLDGKSKFLDNFDHAPQSEISWLDENSATNLIIQPAIDILQYEEDAIREILQLSAGHPFFTQAIYFAAFGEARNSNEWVVKNSDIEKIIDNKVIKSIQPSLEGFLKALPIPEKMLFLAAAQLQEPEFDNSNLTVIELLEKYGLEKHGLFKQDKLEKALEQLIKWHFLEENKSSHKVKIELVRRWLIKKYSLKELIYELEEFDTDANQYYEKARKECDQKNIRNAIELYKKVLKINPNHFTALSNLGKLYLDSQDFSEAINCYNRCYKLDTNRHKESLVTAHLRYGEYWKQQNNLNLAKREFETVLTLDPQHEQARQQLTKLRDKNNPYSVGKPVPAKKFIGRKDALTLATDQINSFSYAIFYGTKAIGKTSFLQYLAAREIWETQDLSKNYFFVYLNCKLISNFTFSVFWKEILNELIKSSNDSMQAEINQVLRKSVLDIAVIS